MKTTEQKYTALVEHLNAALDAMDKATDVFDSLHDMTTHRAVIKIANDLEGAIELAEANLLKIQLAPANQR